MKPKGNEAGAFQIFEKKMERDVRQIWILSPESFDDNHPSLDLLGTGKLQWIWSALETSPESFNGSGRHCKRHR
ncbi:hypothetical protein QVD17_00145 [Tagetes erecta]|uniref:Uncharacterized protein n=1 Tax=Tagetes erecta TaxID=13708 RepID=A0AAD8L2S4_TARER|nr:hypothetical protein QVD17_00145 [Tagetes erecta]